MPISLKNSTSILPWIRYSPQENNMLIAGDDGKPRDISFLGRSFAIDAENGSMGWLLISEGMRDWKPFAINAVTPPSPGPSYKRGFSILFYAPKLLGSPEAFEMCASTAAHLSFCERLYNEAEPQFNKGTVPIVKIIEAKETKIGKGKSREIRFEITKWVPRPAAFTEALKLRRAPSPTTSQPATALRRKATISTTKASQPSPSKSRRRSEDDDGEVKGTRKEGATAASVRHPR